MSRIEGCTLKVGSTLTVCGRLGYIDGSFNTIAMTRVAVAAANAATLVKSTTGSAAARVGASTDDAASTTVLVLRALHCQPPERCVYVPRALPTPDHSKPRSVIPYLLHCPP